MSTGIDSGIAAVQQHLWALIPNLKPSYGLNAQAARGTPQQYLHLTLAEDLRLVVWHKRNLWTSNSMILDDGKAIANKEATVKLGSTDLVVLWIISTIRTSYQEIANMLRATDPNSATYLDMRLDFFEELLERSTVNPEA